jgi:hypothetical protein
MSDTQLGLADKLRIFLNDHYQYRGHSAGQLVIPHEGVETFLAALNASAGEAFANVKELSQALNAIHASSHGTEPGRGAIWQLPPEEENKQQ